MGAIEKLFDEGAGSGRCYKWRHYFEIYERYFGAFAGKPCTYLEIGIWKGGSLDIMQKFLGPQAKIVGVDIDPNCKQYAAPNREILIGDQADVGFLSKVAEQGPFDIIIDDGGHTADQQVTSFFTLFPHLKEGGIYMVEDLHTYFWHGFQGSRYGINFYDLAKGFVEKLSLWNIDQRFFERFNQPREQRGDQLQMNNFATNDIFGIHFYDSVCVIEKRKIKEPITEWK